jgi:RND family efflux transporter MFP subunit
LNTDVRRKAAIAVLGLLLCFQGGGLQAAEDEIYALTEPSSDIVMSFTVAGRVENIPVREGQAVAGGDLLIELNADALKQRQAQLTLEAENRAEVLAAEAELKQKRQDLIKLEQTFSKGAATQIELEHARLDVEISTYQLAAAEHEKAVAALKKAEVAAELREYRLFSPISGLVERLDLEVGETAKVSEEAVRVVALDPLRAEADVPLAYYAELAPGRVWPVTFPGGEILNGTVVFRGAVADSASGTVRVRLEVKNPENRHAGERVILNIQDAKPAIETEPAPPPQ